MAHLPHRRFRSSSTSHTQSEGECEKGLARGRRQSVSPPTRDVGHDDVFYEMELGLVQDPPATGGIWRDEPLVRDRNWVSSRSPADLPVFVPAIIVAK